LQSVNARRDPGGPHAHLSIAAVPSAVQKAMIYGGVETLGAARPRWTMRAPTPPQCGDRALPTASAVQARLPRTLRARARRPRSTACAAAAMRAPPTAPGAAPHCAAAVSTQPPLFAGVKILRVACEHTRSNVFLCKRVLPDKASALGHQATAPTLPAASCAGALAARWATLQRRLPATPAAGKKITAPPPAAPGTAARSHGRTSPSMAACRRTCST